MSKARQVQIVGVHVGDGTKPLFPVTGESFFATLRVRVWPHEHGVCLAIPQTVSEEITADGGTPICNLQGPIGSIATAKSPNLDAIFTEPAAPAATAAPAPSPTPAITPPPPKAVTP